jgi:hypothetical protein
VHLNNYFKNDDIGVTTVGTTTGVAGTTRAVGTTGTAGIKQQMQLLTKN